MCRSSARFPAPNKQPWSCPVRPVRPEPRFHRCHHLVYAALIPIAPPDARRALEARLSEARKDGLYGDPPAYYDQNLILFAQGFSESRYRFGGDGSLAPAWETRCLGRAR